MNGLRRVRLVCPPVRLQHHSLCFLETKAKIEELDVGETPGSQSLFHVRLEDNVVGRGLSFAPQVAEGLDGADVGEEMEAVAKGMGLGGGAGTDSSTRRAVVDPFPHTRAVTRPHPAGRYRTKGSWLSSPP
jgi:hypothetical protein